MDESALYVQIKENYIGPGRGQNSFAFGIWVVYNSARWSVLCNKISQCPSGGIVLDTLTGTHGSFMLMGNDLHQCSIVYNPAQLVTPYVFDHNLEAP